MSKLAVNIVGYIEDDRTDETVAMMLDRASIKECFPPLNIIEIIVKKMPDDSKTVELKKVTKRKLSQI